MKKVLQSLVLLLGVLMLPAATHAQDIYGDVNGFSLDSPFGGSDIFIDRPDDI